MKIYTVHKGNVESVEVIEKEKTLVATVETGLAFSCCRYFRKGDYATTEIVAIENELQVQKFNKENCLQHILDIDSAIENLKKDNDVANARALIHIIDSLTDEMGLAIQVGNQARQQLSQLK